MKQILSYLFLLLLTACVPTPHDVKTAEFPFDMYPDYQNVTIPCNIAPLNFLLRGDYTAVNMQIEGKNNDKIEQSCKGNKLVFHQDIWQQIISQNLNDSVVVTICAEKDGQWWEFPSFKWYISADSIDSYITYRLIEPGYEVWDKVCIEECCIENFGTRLLADGRDLGNRCMNCHTHGGKQGQYSFLHLRGKQGGTLLNRNGQLRKVTLKKEGMPSGAVYGDWHPSGRYGVFSTNVIIPAFHSQGSRRLEVYDTTSDLCVADFDRDTILLPPLASMTENVFETFPAFSADGQWIYYCSAPNPCGDTVPTAADLVGHVEELHYSLCRMAFDAETGTFGDKADTLYNARQRGGSANFPKCSPDGRYLAFCLSESGTFPIWHKETRLKIMKCGVSAPCSIQADDSSTDDKMHIVGELKDRHATYHSWSHNSKWLAFASKEYDGQYSRVCFIHIDEAEDGGITLSKPVVLPQADPEMDDWNLRSFNIPDLSNQSAPYDNDQVKVLLEKVNAVAFK